MISDLKLRLEDQPYQGYAYSYPHKTAYREFDAPIPLEKLWANEDRSSLYFYLHLPFCEMRCGFCNLFTTTNPKENTVTRYLDSLNRQFEAASEFLVDDYQFARGAIGGGTPSFLSLEELQSLFRSLENHLGKFNSTMPLSFELSPATVTEEKLAYLVEQGVSRFSIGVQSFIEAETKMLGRPQSMPAVHQALGIMRNSGAPVINIDLIYGAEIQTPDSWVQSIRAALQYDPEEIYLYPLYVRPLTGLEKIGRSPADARLELYRVGRDLLRQQGYTQISMRLFRKTTSHPHPQEGPVYDCQEDGMVGFGAGARSYTSAVHYCTEYAVGRSGINEIIDDFASRSVEDHRQAIYGCHLSLAEQKRRYLMKSILRNEGLNFEDYKGSFGSTATADFPELAELVETDLAEQQDQKLVLTDFGFERSDTIGPWLFSTEVTTKMNNYELV